MASMVSTFVGPEKIVQVVEVTRKSQVQTLTLEEQ